MNLSFAALGRMSSRSSSINTFGWFGWFFPHIFLIGVCLCHTPICRNTCLRIMNWNIELLISHYFLPIHNAQIHCVSGYCSITSRSQTSVGSKRRFGHVCGHPVHPVCLLSDPCCQYVQSRRVSELLQLFGCTIRHASKWMGALHSSCWPAHRSWSCGICACMAEI